MVYTTSLIGFLLIYQQLYTLGNAIRTKDKMYENIVAAKACYRRLNATHQIGCSSKRGGSTGVIHYCTKQSELDFILENGSAPPYIPIIPTTLFTKSNVNSMKSSDKISGLLLYASSEDYPQSFTHEKQCPNSQSNVPNTCGGDDHIVWNPLGTGLLYEDIPFPVFYVENETNIAFAKKCFQQHNNHTFETQRDRSLCSLQLDAFMYAAINTQTCIRRSNAITNLNPVKFCDPLGDQNVWASLFPLAQGPNFTEPINDAQYIIVSARMDTTSMFDITAGAVSPITGMAALLATAKMLKTMLPTHQTYKKNVLFVLFNGETYDYIGSQRFVYELVNGNFPVKDAGGFLPKISPKDIDLYIELSQLNDTGNFVAHYLTDTGRIGEFVNKLRANSDLNLAPSPGTLPAGSLHTFLRNITDLSGLILTDHRGAYANRFYNSLYDNGTNLNYEYLNLSNPAVYGGIQGHIGKVATGLAKSLFEEITNEKYSGEVRADVQFIDELFHCYLEDPNCRIHQAVQKEQLIGPPLSLYVGVEVSSNLLTAMAGLTLAWITGDVVGEGNVNCTNTPKNYAVHYYNMSKSIDDLNTTLCYRVSMNFTEAVSPAFVIKDYDWMSGEYSTWSESTWADFKVRLFLKPSSAHENMTIAVGSMVFILSLILVYFATSRSDILFAPQQSTLAPTNC